MSNEFWGLEGWDWLELFSLAAIAIGALCDLFLRWKKLRCSPDKNGLIPISEFFNKEELELKRHKWETFWEIVLIFGLIGEIPAALHGIRASAEMKVFAANIGTTNAQLWASNLVLQTNVNETKTQLANAEARLIELKIANSPMDIGDEFSLGVALKQFPGMRVKLRYVMDLKAQATAGSLLSAFSVAGWSIINNQVIAGDIGDGILIGYANGDDSSKNAAYSLLKLLTDRNVPSEVIGEYGTRVRGVPTNAIIVGVSGRPKQSTANLMIARAKDKDLSDQGSKILLRMSELRGEKFISGSKELESAQLEYNSLNLKIEQIRVDETALSEKMKKLYEQRNQEDAETNSSLGPVMSGTFGHVTLGNSRISMHGQRFLVPLE